jgi:hypothetical protein
MNTCLHLFEFDFFLLKKGGKGTYERFKRKSKVGKAFVLQGMEKKK